MKLATGARVRYFHVRNTEVTRGIRFHEPDAQSRQGISKHMTVAAPVFTVIMDTFNRPHYLRHAVEAIRRQTYSHLEIVLVDNGATPETIQYLHEASALDSRIKLIHFHENQYSPADPQKMVFTCGNAALRIATGDYVWYQADDDWLADDYAEKMVALFAGRSDCVTAAGRVVSVDAQGHILDDAIAPARPKYMSGRDLALNHLRGEISLGAPGTIFTIRRHALNRAGGFHRALELSHLYGIVPFGITGYDETAVFYWRRHDQQLNTHLVATGEIGFREIESLLGDWQIEDRWQPFGSDTAREVVSRIRNQLIDNAGTWFSVNWLSGRYAASRRIAQDAGKWPGFWVKLPMCLWRSRRLLQGRFHHGRSFIMQHGLC